MKILFDTNVVLDLMLLREPYFKAAALLMAEVEQKKIDGFVCATTVTTIHYLVERELSQKEARDKIHNILNIFDITEVDKSVLESALHAGFSDYEDAVLYESARRHGIEGIVTRNSKDFALSKIPVFDPDDLLKLIILKR